jgi:hypothetical protein
MTMQIPVWFIPSFHGDIRLETIDEKTCLLIAEKVTPREKAALDKLAESASKKGWLKSPTGSLYSSGTLKTELTAPMGVVARAVARAMKPGRKTISAIVFAGGKMREIYDGDEPKLTDPYRDAANDEIPKAAASVAAPPRGCPSPVFDQAELRARAVLETFLSPDQLEDFRRYNRFISVGSETGHRYMVTSRQMRDDLARYQRTLYDLDEDRPLCVHDWSVPAAEEMLSLHVLLQSPRWEPFLRQEEHDVEIFPELWPMVGEATA